MHSSPNASRTDVRFGAAAAVTTRRKKASDRWWRISDDKIKEARTSDVLTGLRPITLLNDDLLKDYIGRYRALTRFEVMFARLKRIGEDGKLVCYDIKCLWQFQIFLSTIVDLDAGVDDCDNCKMLPITSRPDIMSYHALVNMRALTRPVSNSIAHTHISQKSAFASSSTTTRAAGAVAVAVAAAPPIALSTIALPIAECGPQWVRAGEDVQQKRQQKRDTQQKPKPRRQTVSSKIVVEKLTKNVTEAHLREIFGSYGRIESVDLPLNRQFMTNRGTAYILYDHPSGSESAIAHMHEAQLDGAVITVSIVLPRRAFSRSPPPGRSSRGGPPQPPPSSMRNLPPPQPSRGDEEALGWAARRAEDGARPATLAILATVAAALGLEAGLLVEVDMVGDGNIIAFCGRIGGGIGDFLKL
ncbi:hypothetical protein DV736_g249, partial [Chaetothyriales sp. CBS 134916]